MTGICIDVQVVTDRHVDFYQENKSQFHEQSHDIRLVVLQICSNAQAVDFMHTMDFFKFLFGSVHFAAKKERKKEKNPGLVVCWFYLTQLSITKS